MSGHHSHSKLKKLTKQDRQRILIGIEAFTSTEQGDVKKLKATKNDEFRLRIGPWRVRFRRENDKIIIQQVFNRQDGY